MALGTGLWGSGLVPSEKELFADLPEQQAPEASGRGMPRLRQPEWHQLGWQVATIDDLVARDHPVRAVWAFVRGLDLRERGCVLTKPTENLAAYEYVLRGREFLSHPSRDKNDEAAVLFQRAIDLDPNYAALGGSHFKAVVSGWTEFRQEELEQAEALAQKALALDPMTTSACRLLAFINMYKRRCDLALG